MRTGMQLLAASVIKPGIVFAAKDRESARTKD